MHHCHYTSLEVDRMMTQSIGLTASLITFYALDPRLYVLCLSCEAQQRFFPSMASS